ncbi:beta-propeller domain-containing protein [Acidimicrobiia bacterium EGI L10123]|uniref:beta-propeller domain-containing protein n=1 Tax=Salinilacustrithrix flava TaxID=2957203 RepID=UPI003D7C1A91|nr:beta-propeller domain-containing protein [Acidimicrobiia bacterium EGI L10123]
MRTRHVRRGIRTFALLAAAAVAATACGSEGGSPPTSGGQAFQGLRGAAPVVLQSDRSCDAVLEDFQSFAPAVLSDQMFGVADDGAATTGGDLDEVAADLTAGPSAERAAAPDEAGAQLEAAEGSSSDTNTQEAGIDEPDVVENDGEFVYVVDHGPDQAHLVILEGSTAEVLSRTPLASYGAQLLLQGDRMLVVTSGGYGYPMPMPMPMPMPIEDGAAVSGPVPDEEPIPVDPFPMPTEPPAFAAGTVLQLLDVSDRRAPQVVQTTEIEGQHVSTRVVDGVARVVVSSYPDAQPLFDDVAVRMGGGGDVDAGLAAMEAGVGDTTIDDWLPAFRTTVADDGEVASRTSTEGSLVACEDVFVPEVNAGIAQTSVLRVDFADGFDPADTTTVVAEAGTVYASTSTLYVAANTYVPLQEQGRIVGEDFTTALHAFDLRGDGPAAHLGAGEIPGHLLNQYSLSEHDGYLRAATTEGAPWGGGQDSQSGVRVLQLDGGALVEVGAVTGLGVTETIQSVRFMGPVGYVVTFRQTDPLYVIDLSDPRAPRAVGELKIPGFSSYLHPVGEGRLVGIGRDADLEGRDQGLLVSLFDVADPTAPAQLQTWTQRDAWSVAGDDPKAFLHWAPESAVVVPLERFGGGSPESGIVVLDVADTGITERALVTAEGRYPSRALVVQGRLWSLFDGGVVVSDFANPTDGVFTGFR